jgi:hypothetical protein
MFGNRGTLSELNHLLTLKEFRIISSYFMIVDVSFDTRITILYEEDFQKHRSTGCISNSLISWLTPYLKINRGDAPFLKENNLSNLFISILRTNFTKELYIRPEIPDRALKIVNKLCSKHKICPHCFLYGHNDQCWCRYTNLYLIFMAGFSEKTIIHPQTKCLYGHPNRPCICEYINFSKKSLKRRNYHPILESSNEEIYPISSKLKYD